MRKAVALDPAAPILIASLVDNLIFLAMYKEAKEVSLQGVRQHPQFPNFYIVMSDILHRQGRFGEAAAWIDGAINVNPMNYGSRIRKCNLMVQLADPDAVEVCLAGLQADFPDILDTIFPVLITLQTNIFALNGDTQAAVEYAQEVAATSADPRAYWNLISAYIWNADWEKPRPMLENFLPKFFAEGEITVEPSEVQVAVIIAATMREGDGWSDRGRYLAGQALETMETMQRNEGVAAFGVMDVPAHGVRGERAEALSALREAIDSGWRFDWWTLRNPSFDPLKLDPAHGADWGAMIAELEADIAEQREWYYAHKDDSLQQLLNTAE